MKFQFYKVRLKQVRPVASSWPTRFQFYKVRLKLQRVCRCTAGHHISILQSSIKTRTCSGGASGASWISILQSSIKTREWMYMDSFATLFQFYKVRLKHRRRRNAKESFCISILQSSIKTECRCTGAATGKPFQFYKVRLKPPCLGRGCAGDVHFNSTKFD